MKERPIPFSTGAIPKILDSSKTQTRRVIKPQPAFINTDVLTYWDWKGYEYSTGGLKLNLPDKCPYGQVGDRLFITQAQSPDKTIPLEERFWSRVYKFASCWEWLGHSNRKGYGLISIHNKLVQVHRFSWELHKGDIPIGKQVLHLCDLPWCVNPNHLYLGDNSDNIADKIARGHLTRQYGEDNSQAKLSNGSVVELMSLAKSGLKQRELANRFGIGQSQVSRILAGKRRASETRKYLPPVGHRTLEITNIRVERLQEISPEDIKAEGLMAIGVIPVKTAMLITGTDNLNDLQRELGREEFASLWDSLNAKRGYSWEINPWVWVISYKLLGDTK